MKTARPRRLGDEFGHAGEIRADAEHHRVALWQPSHELQFDAQMHALRDVLRRDLTALRAPQVVVLGCGIEAGVDRECPIQTAYRAVYLDMQQILQRAI